jgi:hypothetical protein
MNYCPNCGEPTYHGKSRCPNCKENLNGWKYQEQATMTTRHLYVAWLTYLYVSSLDNVYETFKAVYGESHVQTEDESDLDYIKRCAEQDFHDGASGAATYQEVFDALTSMIGGQP